MQWRTGQSLQNLPETELVEKLIRWEKHDDNISNCSMA